MSTQADPPRPLGEGSETGRPGWSFRRSQLAYILLSLLGLWGCLQFLGGGVNGADLWAKLSSQSLARIWAALFLWWINFAVSSQRFRLVMLALCQQSPGLWKLFRLTAQSILYSHLAGLGGASDVIRAGYIHMFLKWPLPQAIQAVLYDRVLSMAMLAVIGLTLMPGQWLLGVSAHLMSMQALLWVAILGGAGALAWPSALARIDPPLLTIIDPPGYCSRN